MANSPQHYGSNWKVGDFIVEQNLSFFQANAVKYICRCELKGEKIKDLTKAIHYLQHELEETIFESELTGPGGGISHSIRPQDEWVPEGDPESFDR